MRYRVAATEPHVREINEQTDFALHHFGVEAPQLVADVRPRVRDIVDLVPALRGDPNILRACQHYAATKRCVPLLDADERPRGLLSATRLFGTLVEAIVSEQVDALEVDLSRSAVGDCTAVVFLERISPKIREDSVVVPTLPSRILGA